MTARGILVVVQAALLSSDKTLSARSGSQTIKSITSTANVPFVARFADAERFQGHDERSYTIFTYYCDPGGPGGRRSSNQRNMDEFKAGLGNFQYQ
ncbi:unnamed protein product [Phytophthora fragariaefolia]|uniref:Unnamed protein product n=1 Tax=Phytophthora fragariaefolia TaxID=1490495 RepID=A0A9W7CU26_9STRA|nr:unnamed protein product [Phytophthora fragariaefolia]